MQMNVLEYNWMLMNVPSECLWPCMSGYFQNRLWTFKKVSCARPEYYVFLNKKLAEAICS